MIALERLQHLLDSFAQLKIGVVGDLFLDRYLDIAPDAHEVSVETGLEAYQIPSVRNSPGAAGTVMNNLAALGIGCIVPVSVIGDDGHGYDLRKAMSHLPVDLSWLISDPLRLTPTYTKPLKQDATGNWQELHRLDVRTREPLLEETTRKLCDHVRAVFEQTDGLIVLDQINEENWGVINDQVRASLSDAIKRSPLKLVFIDSRCLLKRFDFGVLKGNRSEICAAADVADKGPDSALDASRKLAQRTGRNVYCTMGDEGLVITRPDSLPESVPGIRVDGPVDIVGAGDSATSGMVASLLAGASDTEAAVVGNLVASITVQQLGTTGTATPQQVLDRWREAYGGERNG